MRFEIVKYMAALVLLALSFWSHASDMSLTDSSMLLASCTVEDNGMIGFKVAETEVEKVFATGRYERTLMGCISFIEGVAAAEVFSEEGNVCLQDVSLGDLKAVVVVNLKQKYRSEKRSVPIILDALRKNWPCRLAE